MKRMFIQIIDEYENKIIEKDEQKINKPIYHNRLLKEYFEEYKDRVSRDLTDDIKEEYQNFSHVAKLKSKLRKEIKEKIENIAYIFTKNNEYELDV